MQLEVLFAETSRVAVHAARVKLPVHLGKLTRAFKVCRFAGSHVFYFMSSRSLSPPRPRTDGIVIASPCQAGSKLGVCGCAWH